MFFLAVCSESQPSRFHHDLILLLGFGGILSYPLSLQQFCSLSRELDSKLGEVSSSSDMSANHLLSSRSLRNKAPASNKSNKRKREEDHTLRLSLLCAEVKEDGWAQVTASTLQPRADVESNICEFKPWCVAPPEYFTAEAIFRHLFTGVISRLVQDMNASFKQRHQGPRDTKVRTTEHQMWALVAVLIRDGGTETIAQRDCAR